MNLFLDIRAHLKGNDFQSLKKVLNASNVNSCDLDYWTPLHLAATQCVDTDIMSWLVRDLGADVNATSKRGNTPLSLAVSPFRRAPSYFSNVKLLLESRANINGCVPLDDFQQATTYECLFNVVWLLLDYGAKLPEDAPNSLLRMHNARQSARRAAVTIVGIRRFRHSKVMNINGMDTTRLIGKLIWQNRKQWKYVEMCSKKNK